MGTMGIDVNLDEGFRVSSASALLLEICFLKLNRPPYSFKGFLKGRVQLRNNTSENRSKKVTLFCWKVTYIITARTYVSIVELRQQICERFDAIVIHGFFEQFQKRMRIMFHHHPGLHFLKWISQTWRHQKCLPKRKQRKPSPGSKIKEYMLNTVCFERETAPPLIF